MFYIRYRKGGMFLNNIVSACACALMFISKPVHSYELLIAGRFLLGLSCGKKDLFFFCLNDLIYSLMKVMDHR